MTIRGYMVEVDFDGETLRARGTGKLGQIALRGERRNEGDVVLTRSQIEGVEFKDASRMVNGELVIRADSGERYQLHFRRKQAADFRGLASALGVTT